MTKEEQDQLHRFETRVRQLIMKYKALETESRELYDMVDERDRTIERLKKENEEWEKRYNTLKTARMIEVTSEDTERAQKRLAHLIRDIDKCIALLNL